MRDFSYFVRINKWMIYESTDVVPYGGCWYDNHPSVLNTDRGGTTRRENEKAVIVLACPKDDHGYKVTLNDERPNQAGKR